MAKRLFDLVFSALALLVLAPLLLCVALWVTLDSPGGAFFRQTRVGRAGKPFRIYKFRTMCADAEASGPAITAQADARITRAGHWLRRTKLDELPQFLNVLIGDMSIVGPRPEVPQYVDLYPPQCAASCSACGRASPMLPPSSFATKATYWARAATPSAFMWSKSCPSSCNTPFTTRDTTASGAI